MHVGLLATFGMAAGIGVKHAYRAEVIKEKKKQVSGHVNGHLGFMKTRFDSNGPDYNESLTDLTRFKRC